MTALKVGTVDPGKVYNWDEDVDSPSEPLQATTTYQSNDTIRVATTVEMEFDDSGRYQNGELFSRSHFNSLERYQNGE